MKQINTNRGYTIIELIVATAIASLVITGVYFTWNSINKHIASSTKTGLLYEETTRIIRTVSADLRRSPQILEWDMSRVVFVSSTKGDTVIYSHDGRNLNKNDTVFPLRIPTAEISEFKIEQPDEDIGLKTVRAHFIISLKVTVPPDLERHAKVDVSVMRPSYLEESDF